MKNDEKKREKRTEQVLAYDETFKEIFKKEGE